MRRALVCAAAISSIAGIAHADELTDLKTQSQQLQQQNQMLMQRISQLEQRQQKIEAVQAAQPAAQPEAEAPKIPADDGSLTWKGITLYGGVDIGVGYQSAGTPLNGDYGPGLEYLISKNSNKSVISLAPNALSYSNVGLKGKEEVLPGLNAIFNVQTQFVPTSGAIANGPQSEVDNNGVALNKQSSNGDSTRAGQPFLEAYAGLSSPTYGTVTIGRQNSLNMDGIIAYDPMGGSNAFSPIGYSGTWGGGGDTQDTRLAGSVKYRVGLGPIRLAALYQAQGYGDTSNQNAYEFGAGTDYAGFSFDAVYSQVNGAETVSPLSAAQFAVEPANSLAATISDNTTWMLLGKYNFGPGVVQVGYEHVQFDNPDHALAADSSGLGGYLLSVVNNSAYTENKVLQMAWGGGKYDVTDQLTMMAGYYHEWQNSYANGKLRGCSSATVSSACSGDLDAVSLVADYKFTKRFDIYAGAMWSAVDGGLANGFLHDSMIDPTIGARFRF